MALSRYCQLAVLGVLLAARPLPAQRLSVWPDSAWWHSSGGLLEAHPSAHLLGGAAVNLLARGPYIAPSWRNTIPKRLAWCAVFQGAWETFQVLEIHRYSARTGFWDWEAGMIGCAATEGLLALGTLL